MQSFSERVEIPRKKTAKYHHHHSIPSYNYSRTKTRYYQQVVAYRVFKPNTVSSACRSSRATGGLLGGSLAAAKSEKDSWGWSIPLGAIIGSGVGDSNC